MLRPSLHPSNHSLPHEHSDSRCSWQPSRFLATCAGSLVARARVPDQPRDARHPAPRIGPLAPVRDFGLYAAIGCLISLVVALVCLPALLVVFGVLHMKDGVITAGWVAIVGVCALLKLARYVEGLELVGAVLRIEWPKLRSALLTRSDPATSIDIITNAWSTPLDPRIEPERKAKGDFTNSRAIIDPCKPFHWRDKYPKVNQPPPEVRKLARQKWGHLLK